MLQHNNERYLCFDMGTNEFLINKMMLNVYPHSAKVQHTCFTAQYQRGQSRDTHVVISHYFVYILRLIEGVFSNYFVGLWWSTEMTPSAGYPD